MNDEPPDLPQSLRRYETELEHAVSRDLSGGRLRRAGRAARGRPRLFASLGAVSGGLAAVAATLVVVLGASGAAPAYAVTRNRNGTVTVRILRVSAINPTTVVALNHRLSAMGVHVRLVTSAPVPATARVLCPAAESITVAPPRLPNAVVMSLDRAGRVKVMALRPASAVNRVLKVTRALATTQALAGRNVVIRARRLMVAPAPAVRVRIPNLVKRVAAMKLSAAAATPAVRCGR